jgi:death on curing protein
MRCLTIEEVLQLHQMLLEQTGGMSGIRERGGLESAVAQPHMTFGGQALYVSVIEKAVAMGFSLMQNHPFVDGNKRIGHCAMEVMLVLNGYEITVEVEEQEQIILQVAAGQCPRDTFREWVEKHVREIPPR